MSASCTSNFLARMCDCQICTKSPPEVDFESSKYPAKSVLEQSQSALFCQCFPHDNIVWIYLCDECKRSNVPNVCRVVWSTCWQHVQVCSRTIKCRVCQCTPSTGILEHFVSKLLTIPKDPISSSLNWWSSTHGVVTLYSCWVVSFANSQYRSTRFFAWPAMS